MPAHPIQPLVSKDGILRFQVNQIVRDLLDVASKHGLDLNTVGCRTYSREDRQQLAQLIGYSLDGYGELSSYVDDTAFALAAAKVKSPKKSDVEIERDYLRKELSALRTALRRPAPPDGPPVRKTPG